MRKNFISSFGRVLMIGFALLASQTVYGEDATMTADLNKPLKDIAKKDRSATLIFAAYLKMTPPPMEIGEDFNQTTIWNKMERWSEVSKWAQANSAMGEALIAAQYATVFGLQYGTKGVDPAWVKAGVTISFGDGTRRTQKPSCAKHQFLLQKAVFARHSEPHLLMSLNATNPVW